MNKFEELQDPDFAIQYLSEGVIDGTLILFLGAGASAGFGLPGWIDFVNAFLAEAGINEILDSTSSSDDRERALDRALRNINHDATRKVEIIHNVLYRHRPTLDSNVVFSQHLLIALSSLLIGRKRGHINRVVTFNYDSMLEWFLGIFGLATRSIVKIPALEGSEDVRIYHPHGYVPHPVLGHESSDFTIVGSLDANGRASNINDLWWHKERDLLRSGVGLFIGLSLNTFRDRAVQPHLHDISEELKKSNERPVGLWIFVEELSEDEVKECLDYSIVPVQLTSKESVPEFLLKICQSALDKTGTD